jgi:PAS domain S-box-containing protein
MKDMDKSKKQLLEEIADLRQTINNLEDAISNLPRNTWEIKQSEELYRLLVEYASEAILVIQKEKIRYVNKKTAEITGYSKKELSSRSFTDFIHPDDRKLVPTDKFIMGGSKTATESFTCRIIDKTGQTRWLEAKLLGTKWGGECTTLCFLIDITERKAAEEDLRISETNYRQLVEYAPAGIYEVDVTTGKFISVNDVMCEYSGYSKEEFLNITLFDVLKEDSLQKVIERVDKMKRGEPVPALAEYEIITKDNRKLWIMINTKLEYENGKPVKATTVAHNITEKKEMEHEILKAQKLESLGVLAGGIGHDFNNLLSGIMGNISLAKLEAERGENIMESLDEALRVSAKASALTRQLLVFSKGGAPVKKAASISEVLRESAAFTLRGSKIKCKFKISKELWPVKVDVGQFSQVIHNLVLNAMQAMSGGGELRLEAKNIYLEKKLKLPLAPGRYVVIKIQDQGKGIAQDYMPQIFDPYFTTKSKGSGLGLTISYTTIKRHDGHITVESELGKGTTFKIHLPATEETPEEAGDREMRPAEGEGRILLMDDEESIRKVAKRMLVELGYEVKCVEDGDEVIKHYAQARRSGQPFEAVIMDLTIPGGMGGKETIEELLKIDSDTIAVVSSGYSNDPIMSNYEKYGFSGVVSKPYRIEELSWVMRDVLKGAEKGN